MVGPNATHVGAVVESVKQTWCACVHGFSQTLELNQCDPAFSFIFWFLPSHVGTLKWIFTPYALPSLFDRHNHGSHMCRIGVDH